MDILGFRKMINTQTHEQMKSIYDLKITPNIQDIHQFRRLNPNMDFPEVKVVNVSDSIVLWVDSDDAFSIYQLISTVRDLMVSLLKKGMPLRGGISTGPLSVRMQHGHINLFGQALTQAYQIESTQQWSGCTIDDKCMVILEREPDVLEALISLKYVVKFTVPNKSGPVKESYVINWPTHEDIARYNAGGLRRVFEMHGKDMSTWDVRVKFDNTVSFFKKCKKL